MGCPQLESIKVISLEGLCFMNELTTVLKSSPSYTSGILEMTVEKCLCIIVLFFEGYTVELGTITSRFYLMLWYENGKRDFS